MSEIDAPFESLEIGGELAELCLAHGIPREWIAASQSLDGLVLEVLEQCDRRLTPAVEGVVDAEDEQNLREVRGLIVFARKAAALRQRAGSAPALACRIEDLERIRAGAIRGEAAEDAEHTAELLTEIGGMCHQINNPLTALMGRVQILKMKPDSNAEAVARALAVIDESSRRVAAHVQELGHLVGRARERLLIRS